MGRWSAVLLLGLLCSPSAGAGLPLKDPTGGLWLNAWFTPQELDAIGVTDADADAYCELMQETSDRRRRQRQRYGFRRLRRVDGRR